MHFVRFPAMALGVAMISLGVLGCSSGDNGDAPPEKSSAVQKGPAAAQTTAPIDTPASAKTSAPAGSAPPAAIDPPVASASSADGAELYKAKTCVACHGADAKTPIMPTYPKIAGQNEQYLIGQMTDIKSGARNNAQSAVMKAVMHLVSDDEIAAIAKWLSRLE